MRKILAIMILVLFLPGCAALPRNPEKTGTEVQQLVLATSLPQRSVEPLVTEFENRTGIWVTVHSGSARNMLELARAGECDLLLGLGADTVEANREIFQAIPIGPELADWVPTGNHWMPFFATRPVLIYNRNLVQNNPPAEIADLLEPMWREQIAFADPRLCDFSAMTLNVLAGGSQTAVEERLAQFVKNVNILLPQTRDAVNEVARGNACIALVCEQMLSEHPALSMGIVYPPGDTQVFTEAAAIPMGAKNEEAALAMLDFLMQEDVQQYAQEHLGGYSVLESLSDPDRRIVPFDSRRAGQQLWAILEAWDTAWEGRE